MLLRASMRSPMIKQPGPPATVRWAAGAAVTRRGRAPAAGGWCHRAPSRCAPLCPPTQKSRNRCRPAGMGRDQREKRLVAGAGAVGRGWRHVHEAPWAGPAAGPMRTGKVGHGITMAVRQPPTTLSALESQTRGSNQVKPAATHLEGLVPKEVDLIKVLLHKPQAVGLVPALRRGVM